MACLKLFSKPKASQPQAQPQPRRRRQPKPKPAPVDKELLAQAPVFQTETMRNPFPVYRPANATPSELEDLVRKVSQDAAVRFELACILFEHKIGFQDLVFGLGKPECSGNGGKVPEVTVLSLVAVNPVAWIMAAVDIASAMSTSEYGSFSVVIAPADGEE